MDSNLDDQLDFFDFHSDKKIMLVYVKAEKSDLNSSHERAFFVAPIFKQILQNIAFAGVLSQEKQKFIDI